MRKSLIVAGVLVAGFVGAQVAGVFLANKKSQLAWTPPTVNEDGTPLTDLAGYNIGVFDKTVDPTLPTSVAKYVYKVTSPTVTSVPFKDILAAGALPVATYRYVVSAVDNAGNESVWSVYIDVTSDVVAPGNPKNPNVK